MNTNKKPSPESFKGLYGTSRSTLSAIAYREGVKVGKRDSATDIRWNIALNRETKAL